MHTDVNEAMETFGSPQQADKSFNAILLRSDVHRCYDQYYFGIKVNIGPIAAWLSRYLHII